MRIDSKLCHLSETKAIVQVNGWINDKNIGSALAEGPTVEIAEDNAIVRLNNRINGKKNNVESTKSFSHEIIKPIAKVELANGENDNKVNINHEPSDWSTELTAIDVEIERLKWSRDDENNFLEKELGYNNRNKITKYNDIIKYLSILKKTGIEDKIKDININTLIDESDNILNDLSWNHIQGREYLLKEFNVSSRKELSEKELISFVENLKSIRNQYLSQ